MGSDHLSEKTSQETVKRREKTKDVGNEEKGCDTKEREGKDLVPFQPPGSACQCTGQKDTKEREWKGRCWDLLPLTFTCSSSQLLLPHYSLLAICSYHLRCKSPFICRAPIYLTHIKCFIELINFLNLLILNKYLTLS